MAKRRRHIGFLGSRGGVHKVTAPRLPTDWARWGQYSWDFVALGVVASWVGDRFHSPRHRHLPCQADDSGTTARMVSASAVAVVTVLCPVDDYFASQLRPKMSGDSTFTPWQTPSRQTNVVTDSLDSQTLGHFVRKFPVLPKTLENIVESSVISCILFFRHFDTFPSPIYRKMQLKCRIY